MPGRVLVFQAIPVSLTHSFNRPGRSCPCTPVGRRCVV